MATWHRQPVGDGQGLEAGDTTATIRWVAGGVTTTKEALEDPSFPVSRNSLHPDYGSSSPMRARSIRIDATGFHVMTVTASYSVPENGDEHEPEPSLDNPVVYAWQTVTEQVAVDRDVNGKAILTSARRAPSGLTKTLNAKRLTVTVWESYFDASKALTWENSVNDSTFEGAAEQEVKLESIQPNTSYTANTALIPNDYVFLFKPADIWGTYPHQAWIMDKDSVGYTSDGPQRFCDAQGNYLTDVRLDGTGRPLDSDVTYLDKNAQPVASPSWSAQSTPTGATVFDAGLAKFLIYQICPARDLDSLLP